MSWFDSDCLWAVFDASPDAIYVKDLEGNYLAINAAGARFVGKTVEEILGQNDRTLFDEPTAARIATVDKQVVALAQTFTYEDTSNGPAGPRFCSTTKGPLFSADGSVRGLFGISRDLHRDRLAEAAYELRGPLGTIANAANLLRRTAVGSSLELLAIVAEESAAASRVVSELLDLRPNLPARSPQLLLRLFESGQPVVLNEGKPPTK